MAHLRYNNPIHSNRGAFVTIRIVTDSTTDIPPAIAAELGITIIPNYINVGEESFLDGVDLTRRQFYERLPHWRTSPSTAAPGIIAFQAAYERLSAEGPARSFQCTCMEN